MTSPQNKTSREWEKNLSPEQYAVMREGATEAPFTGKYWKTDTNGTYYCAVCGNPLFKADSKFASSCGWPSFYEAITPTSVVYTDDHSHGRAGCGHVKGGDYSHSNFFESTSQQGVRHRFPRNGPRSGVVRSADAHSVERSPDKVERNGQKQRGKTSRDTDA